MKIINKYLLEIKYKNIDYSDENYKRLKKKTYNSNGYKWVYVGKEGDYTEMPWHVFVYNKFNPHSRVNPSDGHLIHHKDENKENNAPSNLIRVKKGDHDSDHMKKKRKKYKNKFSKKTSAKGGKSAHANHPELLKNLNWNKKKK